MTHCRAVDRELTGGQLLYPETYLVFGGYEAIFNAIPDACVPRFYLVCLCASARIAVTMLHTAHGQLGFQAGDQALRGYAGILPPPRSS